MKGTRGHAPRRVMVGDDGRVELSGVSCKNWDGGGMERARHVASKAKRGRVWGVIAGRCLGRGFGVGWRGGYTLGAYAHLWQLASAVVFLSAERQS